MFPYFWEFDHIELHRNAKAMKTIELPKRIWDLDAQTLIDLGFDDFSIKSHAEIELDEDLEKVAKTAHEDHPQHRKTLEAKIRDRHRQHWLNFSNA